MTRRVMVTVGTILLTLVSIAAAAPAAADTEGSIVVAVDIAPRAAAAAGDLARAGVDPTLALLLAALFCGAGAAAVVAARRRPAGS